MSEEEWAETLAFCLEVGALTLDVNPAGEVVFGIGPRCQELMPELYQELMNELDETIASLASKGMLDYAVDGDELGYKFTEKGLNILTGM